MTHREYYLSDALQGEANVLRCGQNAQGDYEVELDTTLFHPQGGGQPSDSGTINGAPVLRVENRGDTVIHLLAQPVATGPATLVVDEALRKRHTRWHSAGHLIGYAGEQLGWQPVKAHHWPGEGKITFAPAQASDAPDADALSEKIAAWIAADLPRYVGFVDGRRQVRFGELPVYGCGGTHVASLSQVGEVTLTSIKVKKGQLLVAYQLAD
ncbi:alanyl-tRNA editing protein [Cronobacter turicensis]|uniref:alanyl-tRNA editing protein n=1 Tax=Cronobacter turicensis TaxID=413502 RepID=UPI0024C409B7|nr:alanyl-tRNA editing protein [Cronobacter turicensis]EKM0372545.1 alanyl-tRNA editing protein [Cronobacter turicensis]MDK1235761.1 alanyl-tRNA editing protein [Cronobacter turicensis]